MPLIKQTTAIRMLSSIQPT